MRGIKVTRLFLSLYLFIALALAGLSAALEPLFFTSDEGLSDEATDIVLALETVARKPEERAAWLAGAKLEPRVIPAASLAFSPASEQALENGEVVPLFYQDSIQLYARADDTTLYELTLPVTGSLSRALWYSTVFYVLLGALIALWLWPLWRDLTTITRGLNKVNADGSFGKIWLPKRSVVAPIAKALNQLSAQVTELFNRHKEITGAVAHELRTPLARLKFALATERPADEEGWKAMREDVNELERMVQEMLDYLRHDGRQPELNVSQIPLRAMAENLAERTAGNTAISVSVTADNDGLVVLGDDYYIGRAIENLLLNAIRYARTEVRLRVSDNRNHIVLHVEDDGPGVSEENIEKIFVPFYRPDAARSRERGGAGLGLAIVRRIMLWHDGECEVQKSQLGGADFLLRFPKIR